MVSVMKNPFSLEGKRVLVTGASSGIGRAVAIECSEAGAEVIITGRNKERLADTLSKMSGKKHPMIIADLTNEADIDKIAMEIDRVDGIVLCAGITHPLPFSFSTRTSVDEIMNINFNSQTILTARLVNERKINKGGSIVFISSVSGVFCSSVGNSIYSASKGAINGLVKGMALDLAPRSIRVNSVNPGLVETEIYSSGEITKDQLKADIDRYPLRRHGKPDEIAWAVIYLLSDATTWVTGSALLIDGGYTLL
jgi:NAD(P)-dependent dehydrogenase (short-subunit alcohol dehydrogenase family)